MKPVVPPSSGRVAAHTRRESIQSNRGPRGATAARAAQQAGAAQTLSALGALAPDLGADALDLDRDRQKPSDPQQEALVAHLRAQPWFDDGGKQVTSARVLAEQQIAVPGAAKGERFVLAAVEVRFAGDATGGAATKERFLAPLRLDAQGRVSDGLASPAFKQALVDAVAGGASFEPSLGAADGERTTRARRRPATAPDGRLGATGGASSTGSAGRAKGFLGATLAKAAGDKANALAGGSYDPHMEAAALARAVYAKPGEGAKSKGNPWSALLEKGYTTRERYEHVVEQAKKLSPQNADALVVEFFKNVWTTREAQSPEVRAFHEALATRPKFGPVFYGYAQFMGVPEGKAEATFDDVKALLDIVQAPRAGSSAAQGALASMVRDGGKPQGLGFRELELLPFFASPQKDGGYDISKHDEVAASLGGNEAFGRFMQEVVARGMRVTADLVGNHVSNEHAWVKALLDDGDKSMLSRFVVWDDAVKIGERVVDDKTFNVFLHTKGADAGKVSHVWQIFPDNNPDTMIPARVKDAASGRETKHNVFASFMNPFQWDVNAADPQVLSHYLGVIGHFANLGQMGTRMDAIIHMGKQAGTFNINLPESQAFMALTKAFASHVAPGNTFVPEANLDIDTAKRDWLAPERAFDGKIENTSGDALISFDVHKAIWDSLLKQDKSAWTKAQASLGELPANKSFLVYLGLHDETLIDDPALRKQVVAKGGREFAGRGVGDSPAALLGHDADRLAMAHVLLYSSKGHPAVYYRTLVGADNNEAYFEKKTQERLDAQKASGDAPDLAKARDTRDLDRGPISKADYEKALQQGYKPAVTIRALNELWDAHGAVRTNDIREVSNDKSAVVSYARHATEGADAPLLQLVNLSGAAQRVTFTAAELSEKLGWQSVGTLDDVLGAAIAGAPRSVQPRVEGGRVVFDLAPYESLFLQARP